VSDGDQSSLREAVAAELAAATGRLAEPERQILELRERRRLSHAQIAGELELELDGVAELIARARLELRARLRGGEPEAGQGCAERRRALIALARRQDHEQLAAGEDDWVREHIASCPPCERAHAAMYEASACYRAAIGQ
jgi:hypothetical protein